MYAGDSGPEMLDVLCNSIMPGVTPGRAARWKSRSGPLLPPSNTQQLPQGLAPGPGAKGWTLSEPHSGLKVQQGYLIGRWLQESPP